MVAWESAATDFDRPLAGADLDRRVPERAEEFDDDDDDAALLGRCCRCGSRSPSAFKVVVEEFE